MVANITGTYGGGQQLADGAEVAHQSIRIDHINDLGVDPDLEPGPTPFDDTLVGHRG